MATQTKTHASGINLVKYSQVLKNAEEMKLDLTKIFFEPEDNVRHSEEYSDESVSSLASTIRSAGGLMNPLIITPIEISEETDSKPYALVDGGRRYSALTMLVQDGDEEFGKQVPCRLIRLPDDITAEAQFVIVQMLANAHRKDLNHVDKAIGYKKALECGASQQDLATTLGVSSGEVSQALKILEFPKPVLDMIRSGELAFSIARDIQRFAPPEVWENTAKVVKNKTYADALKFLKSKFGDESSESGESDSDSEASEGKGTSQKKKSLVTPTELDTYYKPFLMEKAKAADSKEKRYTEQDLFKARIDTVNAIEKNGEAGLTKAIQPYIAAIEKKKEEEKQKKEAGSKKDQFFKGIVRQIEELLELPINLDSGKRPYPDLNSAVPVVVDKIGKLSDEDIKKLEFEYDFKNEDKLVEDILESYKSEQQRKAEDRAKREENKRKKEAEKAAEEAKKKAEGVSESSESSETKTA